MLKEEQRTSQWENGKVRKPCAWWCPSLQVMNTFERFESLLAKPVNRIWHSAPNKHTFAKTFLLFILFCSWFPKQQQNKLVTSLQYKIVDTCSVLGREGMSQVFILGNLRLTSRNGTAPLEMNGDLKLNKWIRGNCIRWVKILHYFKPGFKSRSKANRVVTRHVVHLL